MRVLTCFLLLIAFGESRADFQAVCTPVVPNTSVILPGGACGVVNGLPVAHVTVHVLIVTNTAAYRTSQTLGTAKTGNLGIVNVGNAPLGTSCDATQAVIVKGVTYYRIDRRTVTFSGTNSQTTVFAKCQ